MSGVYEFLLLLLFCHIWPLLFVAAHQPNCPPSFDCGYVGNFSFPFTISQRQGCGIFPIQFCDHPDKLKTVQFETNGTSFQILRVVQSRSLSSSTTTSTAVQFRDTNLYDLLQTGSCDAFRNNYTLPHTFPFVSFSIQYHATMFRCNRTLHVTPPTNMYNYTNCSDYNLYYNYRHLMTGDDESPSSLRACTKLHLPIKDVPDSKNPFTFLTADIYTRVELANECADCHYRQGGQCQLNNTQKFCCANAVPKKSSHLKAILLIGLGIGVPCLLVIGLLFLFLLYKRKHGTSGGHLDSRNSYSDSFSDSHRQSSSEYFGVPLFSYAQLKEATSNFDHTKELGDGGFGTVYHGKLSDGREVAVKRLYEHNYRREEQFMNEVRILTRLRHKHLVSLYGCTSRHSRELLLVYEYISNGTVACHLHGGLARPGLLPWSTRMKIAIETASALAYLHASDIIHRDVKTNNILLDSNYCVKVADFGLSRDFPHHVTHVSTAPQGTPGYLDPEYYNCYQLTSKSDVYSFGVVLIELISSMPAVDMNRSRDEINLSNLAVKKIQECAIGELVDPSLGFESDSGVKGMVVSVAGLALQCLQKEKDLRPSMGEVLNELVRIGSGKDVVEVNVDGCGVSHSCAHSAPPPASPEWDEVGLLMNMKPTSPNSVTVKWESQCTTPNVSG